METSELMQLVDQWGAARRKRLSEQHKVDKLEEEEKKLKALVIKAMAEGKVTSVGATHSGANYSKKDKPIASDWQKIYNYIRITNEFDLLQKRLLDSAIISRWEDKLQIPGVVAFPVEDITLFTP
jgi:hypothetical protein